MEPSLYILHFSSSEALTTSELSHLAEHIPLEHFHPLAKALGMKREQIREYERDPHSSEREMTYRMLCDWLQTYREGKTKAGLWKRLMRLLKVKTGGPSSSIERLGMALRHCGLQTLANILDKGDAMSKLYIVFPM